MPPKVLVAPGRQSPLSRRQQTLAGSVTRLWAFAWWANHLTGRTGPDRSAKRDLLSLGSVLIGVGLVGSAVVELVFDGDEKRAQVLLSVVLVVGLMAPSHLVLKARSALAWLRHWPQLGA